MSLVVARTLALPGRLAATDLALAPGTLTALVGPNGSGKTSLLHALAGIGDASGQVTIDGVDLRRAGPARRRTLLSFLPASRDLAWPIPARDLIALSGASEGDVAAIMARLDLADFAERRSDRLSTGERARVLLGRALACRPRLLLLDEPTANLDPLWQLRLLDLLAGEVSGSDRAALVALHDLDAALRRADRIVVMAHGAIAADGDAAAIEASGVIARVFGVERCPDGWRAAPIPAADR